LVISKLQVEAIQAQLSERLEVPVKAVLAMCYGKPSIQSGLQQLKEAGAQQILVLPLYPQYSASTTAAAFDAIAAELRQWRWLPELSFVNHYHDDGGYIAALAQSVRQFWSEKGRPDKLMMSFHGIPQDYFDKGDPYFCECHKTGRLLAEALELTDEQWVLTFQSRLGPKKWLQPYTDLTLKSLPEQGVKHVQVICPGFSADCLETLEEIAMENRDTFIEAGGETYDYIPCLNAQPDHIKALTDIVLERVQPWVNRLERSGTLPEKTQVEAKAKGAES